jgi:hypothetical protein
LKNNYKGSKIKNFLEVLRISKRTNELKTWSIYKKSYPFDIAKALKNQSSYYGNWSNIRFSKNSLENQKVLLTSSSAKFAISGLVLQKEQQKIEEILPETLISQGKF